VYLTHIHIHRSPVAAYGSCLLLRASLVCEVLVVTRFLNAPYGVLSAAHRKALATQPLNTVAERRGRFHGVALSGIHLEEARHG
jgi:hypothetical protein